MPHGAGEISSESLLGRVLQTSPKVTSESVQSDNESSSDGLWEGFDLNQLNQPNPEL